MIRAIAIDDEPLALKVIQNFCERTDDVALEKTFTQPSLALKHLRKFPVDLLFVDIHMPSLSGIQLVKALDQHAMVIFTTAFSEYAATSYELNAIDYLLKPISYKRFEQAMRKAKEYYQFVHHLVPEKEKYLYIRADLSLVKVKTEEIAFIEGFADYLKIYIRDQKTLVVRMTMKELIEKLPAEEFIRVHRSFIVPFDRITAFRGNTLYLEGKEIPLGKTYVSDFKSRYGN